MLGLFLAAMFVTAGAAATGAFAEGPAWYACAKASPKNTGDYKNKTCSEASEAGKGEYEIEKGVGKAKAFKGKGGATVLHVKSWLGDDTVECASSKDAGKPAAPNLEKDVTVTYAKCKLFGTHNCTSAGAPKEGEIVVPAMQGELGYVEEPPSTVVGLKLESEATPGGPIVEFNCEILRAKLKGEVIGVAGKDLNVVTKESELLDEATERYGEHEFEGKKFKPLVNILGWADEVAGIEEAQRENNESSDPAHVLKGEFCGEFIEELLHVECTPEAYAGLDQKIVNKGEALMIKA